jgi:hypothetical protein
MDFVDWNSPSALRAKAREMQAAAAGTARQAAKFQHVDDNPPPPLLPPSPFQLDRIRGPDFGPRVDQAAFEAEVRTGRALAQIEMAWAGEQAKERQQQEDARREFRRTSAIGRLCGGDQ